MIKKVLCIIVNYNAHDDTLRYLKSIEESKLLAKETELDIKIVDNSPEKSALLRESIPSIKLNLEIIDNDNNGYFGAFKVALEHIGYDKVSQYDHVIISNVDLELSEDFFIELQQTKTSDDVGVLAPSIISKFRGNDLNPKILVKPKKRKILQNYFLFKYPLLFNYYAKLSDKKIKTARPHYSTRTIYAPHGSFIIFNKSFFERGGQIDYPVFLFGEEIYVAETMKRFDLTVQYTPNLKVYDFDHGSTSKESRAFIAGEHRKALYYILKQYY